MKRVTHSMNSPKLRIRFKLTSHVLTAIRTQAEEVAIISVVTRTFPLHAVVREMKRANRVSISVHRISTGVCRSFLCRDVQVWI
jgi:hypothetical protein